MSNSLIKWATPERRKADKVLPVVPTEIYLLIFEHVAPPTKLPNSEELETLVHLSGVCRFFANACLPRIYESVTFYGSVFSYDTSTSFGDVILLSQTSCSRGSVLRKQVSTNKPLALSLAKHVRVCHFLDWQLNDPGSWIVRLFAQKSLDAMTCMRNLRKLTFFKSFVDSEHWRAISSLELLEELSFNTTDFLPDLGNAESKMRVDVHSLQVLNCTGHLQVAAARFGPSNLRNLATDLEFSEHVDWPSLSSLSSLSLSLSLPEPFHPEVIHSILAQAPKSVEELALVYIGFFQDPDTFNVFDDTMRKNLPLLHKLSLSVRYWNPRQDTNPLSSILDSICLPAGLQSLQLTCGTDSSLTEAQDILNEKVGPGSNLKHVMIDGIVLHLLDGLWSEVSDTA